MGGGGGGGGGGGLTVAQLSELLNNEKAQEKGKPTTKTLV